MTTNLILLRHGESEWNAKNLFTGWVDVRLSSKGEAEAKRGGELLVARNLLPNVVHTSLLRRAIHTSQLALDAADRHWIPVRRSWRLNERHYGALQGKDKAQTLAEYGEEQFQLWRRSFDVPPPPIDDNDEFSQKSDPRYVDLGAALPQTECLKDVIKRMIPYWTESIIPDDFALMTGPGATGGGSGGGATGATGATGDAVPAGARAGQKMRLRGRGFPGDPPGDQYVVLRVVTPPADTPESRSFYEEMARRFDFDPRADLR